MINIVLVTFNVNSWQAFFVVVLVYLIPFYFSTATELGRKRKPQAASSATRWAYKSRTVDGIVRDLDAYRHCFQEIAHGEGTWTPDCRSTAQGFVNKLEDFNFLFLLYSYHSIFTVTDIMYKKLQKVGLDLGWSSATIESALSQLKDLEDNRFDDIYDSKVDVDPPTNSIRKRSTKLTDYIHKVPAGDNITLNHRERYKELYTEILKETRSCIQNRFGNINELKFCKLLNYEKYAIFNSKDNFPDDVLTDLKNSVYGSLFDT